MATPELRLEKDEANMLAQASADVLRHYPSFQPAAEVTDWIGLITVMGMIYGPRFMAIRNNRRRTGRHSPSTQSEDKVVDFNVMRAAASAAQPAPQSAVSPAKAAQSAPKAPSGPIEIPGLPGVIIMRPSP